MEGENKSVHKESSEEEQYKFVKQTVHSKRKNKRRKVFFTLGMAIMFGVVSSIVFCICLPLFSNYFEVDNKHITIGKVGEYEGVAIKTEAPTVLPVTVAPTTVPTVKQTDTPKPTKTPKTTSKTTAEPIVEVGKKIQTITEKVNRSIVKVTNTQGSYNLFNNSNQDTGSTAGIIVAKSKQYLLIYVAGSKVSVTDSIMVTFRDNSVVDAKLYSKREDLGIVIIAVEIRKLSQDQLQSVEVASFDTNYEPKTGNPVLALGSPNGHIYSMEYGYIANEPYNEYIVDNAVKLINTTIDYNANGEGILVNLSGNVIGFITHSVSFTNQLNTNVNTCFSIQNLMSIITKMVNKIDSTYFGITANDITPEIAYKIHFTKGIYVMKVESDSPAFLANIMKGDIITAINGVEINDVFRFNEVINAFKDKEQVQVEYYRSEGQKRVQKKTSVKLTIEK